LVHRLFTDILSSAYLISDEAVVIMYGKPEVVVGYFMQWNSGASENFTFIASQQC
jgi:hypothetical protein